MLTATWIMAAAFAGPDASVVLARIEETKALRAGRLMSSAPEVRAEDYATAASGSTATHIVNVSGVSAKKAYGVVVLPVNIDAMWAAVNDDFGKVDNTRLSYAEVLSGKPCGAERTVFQYLPLSIVSDRWWISLQRMNTSLSERSEGRVREMTWKSIKPMEPSTPSSKEWAAKGYPLDFTEGAWLLVDIDGQNTLVEYYTWSDPGGSVPAGMASSFAAGSIKTNFQDMLGAAKKGQDARCKG